MTSLGKGAMRAAVVRLAFASMVGPLASCPASPGLLPLLEEIGTPAQPIATPGDGQVLLAWSLEGATAFNVYYSETPGVTKADAKVVAAASPAVITGLTNGSVYYFALSALSSSGEGPLSSVACAMPTPAKTEGLTLYDPLCEPTLDGSRWGRPGASSVGVSGGGAVLAVDVPNQAPTSEDALHYWAGAAVKAAILGQRVTTLGSDMRVPAGTASATGSARARGVVRLRYQPTAVNVGPPQQDALKFEAGLLQTPDGLKAFRTVAYCAAAGACTTLSAAGISFVDPPSFSRMDETTAAAPAVHDTTYTITVRLDEASGVFHWTIAGGTFGAGVSGSADPAGYLASAPAWSGVPLAGEAFQTAQIWAETFDTSAAGGGSGKIAVRFDNVRVGFDGGAAAQYDDFSGTGENSGPFDLSANKWVSPGSRSALPSGGSLAIHVGVTSAGYGGASTHEIALRSPSSVNTLQADVSIPSFSSGPEGDVQAIVEGSFYNDGTPDDTPSSRLGDIRAKVGLYPRSELAAYWIDRCADAACSGLQTIAGGQFEGVSGGTSLHTVLVRWDPAVQRFTFAVDGNVIEVDPTAQAPVAAAPRYPTKRIIARASTFSPSSPAGTRASIDVKVNNVFVAP